MAEVAVVHDHPKCGNVALYVPAGHDPRWQHHHALNVTVGASVAVFAPCISCKRPIHGFIQCFADETWRAYS